MAKNIAVMVGDNLENFQGVEIARFNKTGGGTVEFAENPTPSTGTGEGNIFTVTFYSPDTITDNKKAEIAALFNEILSASEDFSIVMNIGGNLVPAALVLDSRYKNIVATQHGTSSYIYTISLSSAGAVSTAQEWLYLSTYTDTFGSSAKAPTANVVAQFVADYVEQYGGASDEQIAAAIEAYFEENPIVTEETDPTVPAWAKAATKPSYTAAEVGALPSTYTPPDQTAEQVGADPKGTAAGAVSAHNTSDDAHSDIRLLIKALTDRLNGFLDIDDTTADQLSEVLDLISDNADLIEGITTSKVNVSDIINNLTTNVASKPLSAAQGVALKKLIDAITVPTKLSDLAGDTTHRTVTDAEKTAWNAKSNFSGAYADLTGKPTIPTVPTNLSAFNNDAGYVKTADLEAAVDAIGTAAPPDYWLDELETKADAIQQAMEKAGQNKSAFLWYTDAHWINGNSKMSPKLLYYLYRNTPMNKVNFGGDVIGDRLLATREEMKYLYEWRKATKDLPNHHSVVGNHDLFTSDEADFEGVNFTYAYLLAPEESFDIVPGHRFSYYIDNPCEKTRYLYLDHVTSSADTRPHGKFIAEALHSTPEGWHIVAIKHRWFQYSSTSTPTTGSIPAHEAEILAVFDAYNSRTTYAASDSFEAQDFTNAVGKVEFCVGGHLHVYYIFYTATGIPVILTASDTNQNKSVDFDEDGGDLGTITEAAVHGIIADYNDTTKITLVGIGRGESMVITPSGSTVILPASLSNISYSGDTTVGATVDASKFGYTVNYTDGSTSVKTGGVTVSPSTIASVGSNSFTITYTESGKTITATATIIGTSAAPAVENMVDYSVHSADWKLNSRYNSSLELKTGVANHHITNVFHVPTSAQKVYMKYMNPTGSYARIYPFASADAAKPAANLYINPASGATWTTRLDGTTDYYVIDMAAFRSANASYASTEYFAIGFYFEDDSYSPSSAIVQIDEEIV